MVLAGSSIVPLCRKNLEVPGRLVSLEGSDSVPEDRRGSARSSSGCMAILAHAADLPPVCGRVPVADERGPADRSDGAKVVGAGSG